MSMKTKQWVLVLRDERFFEVPIADLSKGDRFKIIGYYGKPEKEMCVAVSDPYKNGDDYEILYDEEKEEVSSMNKIRVMVCPRCDMDNIALLMPRSNISSDVFKCAECGQIFKQEEANTKVIEIDKETKAVQIQESKVAKEIVKTIICSLDKYIK